MRKPLKKPDLGQQQLEVLRYVSDHAPVTVAQVAEHFAQTQGLARTTILTVMERLRDKGYLTREKQGPAYEYSPSVPKSQLLRGIVARFVEETLDGSFAPFLAYLSQETEVSEEELRQLKRLVRELEAQQQARNPSDSGEDSSKEERS